MERERKMWTIKDFPSDVRKKVVTEAILQDKTVAVLVEEIVTEYFMNKKMGSRGH